LSELFAVDADAEELLSRPVTLGGLKKTVVDTVIRHRADRQTYRVAETA
jgi:hypothetical protein